MKLPPLKSLCLQTELMFPAFEGEVVDRGRYVLVRTPSNPNFYWGNYLIFPEAPRRGEAAHWLECFAQEFPNAKHVVLAWDDIRGNVGESKEFLDRGFWLDESVILTAERVHPPLKFNSEVRLRPLESDADWESSIKIQVECRSEGHEPVAYEAFKRRQMDRYRRMAQAGLGYWMGAFLGGELVGDLGIFAAGNVGRFQNVSTHPAWQRQGICGTLVHWASQFAFERMQVKTLVMSADEHYHAAKIYESVGFVATEKLTSLCRWDRH